MAEDFRASVLLRNVLSDSVNIVSRAEQDITRSVERSERREQKSAFFPLSSVRVRIICYRLSPDKTPDIFQRTSFPNRQRWTPTCSVKSPDCVRTLE